MRKEIKVVICVFLAVWCFFMGFELGSYKEKKAAGTQTNVTVNSQPTTAVTTTAAPVTTTAPQQQTTAPVSTTEDASAQTTTGSNNEPSTEATANNDVSSMSKEEIANAVLKAVNQVKAEQNMTAKKTEKVTINLTDLSISWAKDTVNGVIQKLAGEDIYTYTFVNGQGTGIDENSGKPTDDGNTVTPYQVIPPTNKDYALTIDGIVDASASKEGSSTVYKIKLAEEQTTFTEPIPKFHSSAYGYLDLTSLDISAVTITDASMHYSGADIEVTVNEDGKVEKLHFYMPMNGTGAAKLMGFTGDAAFEGSDNETWEFTY